MSGCSTPAAAALEVAIALARYLLLYCQVWAFIASFWVAGAV